jgi:hypothetical protein
MNSPEREGVSVILPIADASAPIVAEWESYLKTCGREWEVLTPPLTKGFGAAFRSALESARHPLVLLTTADYPYTPADLGKFLERMDTPSEIPDPRTGEWVMRLPDLVAGVRTGRPVPAGWKVVGWVVRNFCRFVLGFPLPPLASWYGFREHLRAWRAWAVYGVPFTDPHCGFKLIRRSFLDRFPIQCDGDLVHIELTAKATFLTVLLDELPLTPKSDSIPYATWDRKDKRELFGRPRFWKPSVSSFPSPLGGEGLGVRG